jgi:DNA primase
MPGIDYQEFRRRITMREVLERIGFHATSRRGPQLRGRCPLPGCRAASGRSFSVHLARQVYHCFACRSHGNALDLWAAARGLSLYQAAVDLCHVTRRSVPYRAPARNR